MPGAIVSLGDEVLDHLLGVLEVGDHAVPHRAHGHDVRRSPPQHAPGLGADAQDLAGALAHSDDGRLIEDDAAAAHVYERVRSAEVDADVG